MKIKAGISLALLLAAFTSGSYAADAAAGKAIADKRCADCHESGDFAGEDPKALGQKIKDVATGKLKHKSKVSLSDAEIADVAAYWAAGEAQ